MGVRCKQTDVAGQKREEIDDPVETKHVAPWAPHAEQPRDVFQREENREGPLEVAEKLEMSRAKRLHAFHHHHRNADPNGDEQRHVEHFSTARIALKNDRVEPTLPPPLIARRAMPEERFATGRAAIQPITDLAMEIFGD